MINISDKVTHVHVFLFFQGAHHIVDSNEIAFISAACGAVEQGIFFVS